MRIWRRNRAAKKAQRVARFGLTLVSDRHEPERPVLESEEVQSGRGRNDSHDLVERLRKMLDSPLAAQLPNPNRPSGSLQSAQS